MCDCRNCDCRNCDCRNCDCRNYDCRNYDCRKGDCRKGDCRKGDCRNSDYCGGFGLRHARQGYTAEKSFYRASSLAKVTRRMITKLMRANDTDSD